LDEKNPLLTALHPSSTPITFLRFDSNTHGGDVLSCGAYGRNSGIQFFTEVFIERVMIYLNIHPHRN